MKIELSPELRDIVERKLAQRQYATVEDLLQAGIAALELQEHVADFDPGELDRLLAEGEQSIAAEGTLTGERVFAGAAQRTARRRRA